MLKGIDPLLGPELLATLRAMGHGDEIVIADANFPASEIARRLIRMEGVSGTRVLKAIAGVLPIEDGGTDAVFRMENSSKPGIVPDVCRDYADILEMSGYMGTIEPIERHAFYARARTAFAVIATGELRLWGNLILTKGAIAPDVSESS